MNFNIWQSFNGGIWCLTWRQGLNALDAAQQLDILVKDEIELRKTQPGKAKYEIRIDSTEKISVKLLPIDQPAT